jgi:hypothetical protein
VGGLHHCPGIFTPVKIHGTHCTGSWVGPSARMDACGNLAPPGFDFRTIQPIASFYIDYAIPVQIILQFNSCLLTCRGNSQMTNCRNSTT